LSAATGPLTATSMSSGKRHLPFPGMTKALQISAQEAAMQQRREGKKSEGKGKEKDTGFVPRPPPPQEVVEEKEKEYEGD
jgi:hypothetical protein